MYRSKLLFRAFFVIPQGIIDHIHAPLTEKFSFRRGSPVPGVKGGIINGKGDCVFRRAGVRGRGVSCGGVLLHEAFNEAS